MFLFLICLAFSVCLPVEPHMSRSYAYIYYLILFTVLYLNSVNILYRLVAILCAHTTQSEYPIKNNPITTDRAILLPLKHLMFTKHNAYVTSHIDVTVYLRHLQDLVHFKSTLTNKISLANVTANDFPSFKILSKNLDRILQDTCVTLLTAVEGLEHHPACANQHRDKRDLSPDQGLLPGLGRALSWLTGTLSAEAADYINANTHNLKRIQKSELHVIKVLNHTNLVARANAARLQMLQKKLSEVTYKLQDSLSAVQQAQVISAYYLTFTLITEEFTRQVHELTLTWHHASEGKLSSTSLKGPFYDLILSSLDPATKNIRNLKHLIKKLTSVSIDACHRNIYVRAVIPLIEPSELPFYRVLPTPIPHNNSYDLLANLPHAVSWSNDLVYEFTTKEFEGIVTTRSLAFSKPPNLVVPLKDSCIFSLINNLFHQCTLTHTPEVPTQLALYSQFLYFSYPSSKEIAIFQCPNEAPAPRELSGTNVALVNQGCTVKVGNIILENKVTQTAKQFNVTPTFAMIDASIAIPTANRSFLHIEAEPKDNSFMTDVHSLQVASETLGNFELPAHHIVAFSIGISSVVLLLLTLVIILVLIICGPCKKCAPAPPPQIIHMTPIHKSQV